MLIAGSHTQQASGNQSRERGNTKSLGSISTADGSRKIEPSLGDITPQKGKERGAERGKG